MVVYESINHRTPFLSTLASHSPGVILTAVIACIAFAPNALAVGTLVYASSLMLLFLHLCKNAYSKNTNKLSLFDRSLSGFILNSKTFWPTLFFCAYLFVNALWAGDTSGAISKAFYVTLSIVLIWLSIDIIKRLPDYIIARQVFCAMVGAVLAVTYLLIEIVTNQSLVQEWLTLFPWLAGQHAKGVLTQDGVVNIVYGFVVNKNIGALSFILWPVSFLMVCSLRGQFRWFAFVFFVCATAICVFLSESETAKVAFILSGIALIGSLYLSGRAVDMALKMFWVGLVLLTVPLLSLPYQMNMHQNDILPYSARDRIYIWSYTAEQIQNHFIFGVGLRSTRYKQAQFQRAHPELKDTKLHRRPGWHAHNLFLQTWYELGLIGAVLLLILGWQLISCLKQYDRQARSFMCATFVMVCAIYSFGWGMWQSWLIACFLLTLIIATLIQKFRQSGATGLKFDL